MDFPVLSFEGLFHAETNILYRVIKNDIFESPYIILIGVTK